MHVHHQRFAVSFDYPVYFVRDAFHPSTRALVDAVVRREPGRRHRVAFVVEARVAELWPGLVGSIEQYVAEHASSLELIGHPWVLPGTEACKNDPALPLELVARFDAWRLDRQAAVVIIGGGAFQDMAGYAAAIAHRGLRVVRLPTTVLSQNDGGIGVKNGVNGFGKKNLVGTFAPPFAVVDDFRFLETLEARDKAAGMAEAVKVALLKDAGFFEWMVRNADGLRRFEPEPLEQSVRRCAVLHLEHIAGAGDPFELGSSRPLDFGHWAAHKLESLTNYSIRHGEAVAVGLAIDTRYSVEIGMLEAHVADAVTALLDRLGLPTWDDMLERRDGRGQRMVIAGLEEFREHLGGDLTLMMLETVGKGREVHAVDFAALERSIEWLKARHGQAFAPPVARPSAPPSASDEL